MFSKSHYIHNTIRIAGKQCGFAGNRVKKGELTKLGRVYNKNYMKYYYRKNKYNIRRTYGKHY